jgi:hypothetical protein
MDGCHSPVGNISLEVRNGPGEGGVRHGQEACVDRLEGVATSWEWPVARQAVKVTTRSQQQLAGSLGI